MLIVCPTCQTSYQVNHAALGEAGRSVRCARCRTVWLAQAENIEARLAPAPADPESEGAVASLGGEPFDGAAEPQAADIEAPSASDTMTEQAAATAGPDPQRHADPANGPSPTDLPAVGQPAGGDVPPLALSEITIPASAAPAADEASKASDPVTLQQAREDIESIAARRRMRPIGGTRSFGTSTTRRALPALILLFAAVVAGLIAWRATVVRHLPQLASLYQMLHMPVNLRGLRFADIRLSRDTHDGVPVLVVEGQIVSSSAVPVEVPRLRFALRNAAGGEVYTWTVPPAQPTLAPGAALPFRSRLAAPPEDVRDVLVRFYNRRDTVAGLR